MSNPPRKRAWGIVALSSGGLPLSHFINSFEQCTKMYIFPLINNEQWIVDVVRLKIKQTNNKQ